MTYERAAPIRAAAGPSTVPVVCARELLHTQRVCFSILPRVGTCLLEIGSADLELLRTLFSLESISLPRLSGAFESHGDICAFIRF